MKLFNQIFSKILDTYYINIDEVAVEIDRHPSRIRHWKTDSKPSKYIIEDLTDALLKQIRANIDDSKNNIFMADILQIIESNNSYSNSPLVTLKSEHKIESFIKTLINTSYSYDNKTHKKHNKTNNNLHTMNHDQLELDLKITQAFEASGDIESAKSNYIKILNDYKPILDPHMRANIYSQIGFINFILLQNTGDTACFDDTVTYYTLCIKDFNKFRFPLEYAIILKKFGSLYLFQSEFIDSELNIEKALFYYNEALKYTHSTDNNIERLRILHNVAVAYTRLSINIEPLDNIEKSIQIFNLIFESNLLEEQEFKALCDMNIGLAYSSKIKIKFSNESSEKALSHLNSALNHFSLERNPHYYATIKNSIGMTYASMASITDPAINCLKAVEALKEALWVYSNQGNHRILFFVHNNLVNTYLDLFIETNNEKYLFDAKISIEYLAESIDLSEFNVQVMCYYTLLGLYNSALYKIGQIADIELVLQPFDKVLNHHQSFSYPIAFADCMNSKCNALLCIYEKNNQIEFLQSCLTYKDQLFTAFNALSSPVKYANLNIFYGMVYSYLDQHHNSDLYKSLSKEHYNKAITIFNKSDYIEKYDFIKSKLLNLNTK